MNYKIKYKMIQEYNKQARMSTLRNHRVYGLIVLVRTQHQVPSLSFVWRVLCR